MSRIDTSGAAVDRAERRKSAVALRKTVPHGSHAAWAPAADRPDPLSLLQQQDESRLQHLLPIKYGRMLASPFAFLRGSAVVMACDLVGTPVTGLNARICGDAHISNFGLYASAERKLIFDVNDFDESIQGPWEWDLKRLAASAVVAGRGNNLSAKASRRLAVTAAETYRAAMQRLSQMSNLDLWYFETSVDVLQRFLDRMTSKKFLKKGRKLANKASTRTQAAAVKKLTRMEGGERRIIHRPPLIESLRESTLTDLMPGKKRGQLSVESFGDTWAQYLGSLPPYRQMLLSRFRATDAALRVGGVGSVGTRCFVVLLEGDRNDEALLLQLKEAGPSSLAPYLAQGADEQHGERVVFGQRMMQTSTDVFLGWHTSELSGLNYYWRQFKDMKGSADVATMNTNTLQSYVAVCSGCLAHSHARSGDAASISSYAGTTKAAFPEAIADFAVAYADQTERDYQVLADAVKSGRIVAQTGI